LRLQEAEYDRKMKLQEERILMRRQKQDDRSVYELKRKQEIDIDELKQKIDEQQEETDYYKSKVDKLEQDNSRLKTGKGDNKRVRELENEIEMLKTQSRDGGSSSIQATAGNLDLRNVKKQLSNDETIQLQREL